MLNFTKMHGLGNDYVYLDCTAGEPDDLPGLARRVSDRHFGVGSDGLICICPSEQADFRMRMFNADGSEGEMCGNGIRCVGKFVYDKGLTHKTSDLTIETLAGVKHLELYLNGERVDRVTVDMGVPETGAPMELEVLGRAWQVWPGSRWAKGSSPENISGYTGAAPREEKSRGETNCRAPWVRVTDTWMPREERRRSRSALL